MAPTLRPIHSERRSFQITGAGGASAVGSTNTHVVAFTNAAAAKWGTPYGIATTHLTPATVPSGVWVGVVNDAVFGTTFKFWRRGLYQFNVFAPIDEDTDTGVSAALDLDSASTSLVATTNVGSVTTNRFGALGVIDMDELVGVAGATLCIKLAGVVAITDAMAGGDAPGAVVGAQGVGVVRLLINDAAGGPITTLQATRLTLWCNYIGDLAGS